MGNCALKPKVLFDAGAPAPEDINDLLLEDEKIDSAKSLSNLFLQDMNEKKINEDDKITPENMAVIEDLKTALADDKSPTKEVISPTTEIKCPVTETISPTMEIKCTVTETISPTKETTSPVVEIKSPSDDQKVKDEEVVREDKVIDFVTVKESETEAKAVEVGREA